MAQTLKTAAAHKLAHDFVADLVAEALEHIQGA